jgi:predicted amidohydrolase
MNEECVGRAPYKVGREQREWIASTEWDFVSPSAVLAPRFTIKKGLGGTPTALVAEGNSRPECIGYARCRVRLTGGAWYRLAVRIRFQDLSPLESHSVHGLYGEGYSGGLLSLDVHGAWAYGEERFPGPATDLDAELRLYFRFSARGRIRWENVELQECDAPGPRLVTFACHHGPLASEAVTIDYWERWLDIAGQSGANLTLLPEVFNNIDPNAAEAPDGPAAMLLSEKARRWGMLTCGTRYERRGDLIHNTARLFGRTGELLGIYDKLILFEDELDGGVSPGRRSEVFRTVLGNIGIMTCYDGWFPEVAQSMARQGAEIVLFPSFGYYVSLGPARAADNGVCLVASSLKEPAGVWDSSGARAGEMESAPSRESPTGILDSRLALVDRMLLATVDLTRKYSPHWKGGPLRSAPAGRLTRWNGI